MQDSNPDSVHVSCPGCGQGYRIRPEHVGKTVHCRKCDLRFIARSSDAAETAPADTAAEPGSTALCAICQSTIGPREPTVYCPDCKARYHSECWDYNRGCAVYGCSQVPPTEHLGSLEIPAAYWGKEEKQCPSCGQTILAAAVRCRHCGATFSSARPEGSGEFRQRSNVQQRLPAVRRTAVWLLVLSVLSCTAPLVAIFGTLWYGSHREEVEALPPIHSAICKIALGVSYVQSAVLLSTAVLYGVFG